MNSLRQVAGLDSEARGLLMLSSIWKFCVVAVILVPASLPVAAEQPTRLQIPTSIPRSPYPQRPHPLIKSSGYIFAGTVQSIERAAPKRSGIATVRISFHVDQAMRGVRTGQTLALREWAGLWESAERYRRGERVLLFLYPPSKLGLTSPVAGPLGRFRIGTDGHIVVDPKRIGLQAPHPGVPGRLAGRISFSPRELVHSIRLAEEE
jgi:hypothetical protein